MLKRTFATKIAGRHNGPNSAYPKSPNGLSFPRLGPFLFSESFGMATALVITVYRLAKQPCPLQHPVKWHDRI
jgi:hypothetical protein